LTLDSSLWTLPVIPSQKGVILGVSIVFEMGYGGSGVFPYLSFSCRGCLYLAILRQWAEGVVAVFNSSSLVNDCRVFLAMDEEGIDTADSTGDERPGVNGILVPMGVTEFDRQDLRHFLSSLWREQAGGHNPYGESKLLRLCYRLL
jgi:hypothetical protein